MNMFTFYFYSTREFLMVADSVFDEVLFKTAVFLFIE